MKAKELAEFLLENPESEVKFRGYACGKTFVDDVKDSDFEIVDEEVIIKADWN